MKDLQTYNNSIFESIKHINEGIGKLENYKKF